MYCYMPKWIALNLSNMENFRSSCMTWRASKSSGFRVTFSFIYHWEIGTCRLIHLDQEHFHEALFALAGFLAVSESYLLLRKNQVTESL